MISGTGVQFAPIPRAAEEHDSLVSNEIDDEEALMRGDSATSVNSAANSVRSPRTYFGFSRKRWVRVGIVLLLISLIAWQWTRSRSNGPPLKLVTGDSVTSDVAVEVVSTNPLKRSMRILLLGDSLTVGYWRHMQGPPHPYLLSLSKLVAKNFPHLQIAWVMDATSGECVTQMCVEESLVDRVKRRVQGAKAQYFDVAIVMGGTNSEQYSVENDGSSLSTLTLSESHT
jgi:hypothetical protein